MHIAQNAQQDNRVCFGTQTGILERPTKVVKANSYGNVKYIYPEKSLPVLGFLISVWTWNYSAVHFVIDAPVRMNPDATLVHGALYLDLVLGWCAYSSLHRAGIPDSYTVCSSSEKEKERKERRDAEREKYRASEIERERKEHRSNARCVLYIIFPKYILIDFMFLLIPSSFISTFHAFDRSYTSNFFFLFVL